MAPILPIGFVANDIGHPTLVRRTSTFPGDWRANATAEQFVLEGWSEGCMVGALVIMACVTVANMRRGVMLHKLVLAEQLFAMSHGTFAFMSFDGYGYYLSSTAALLYISWVIHNVVAWMKVRPFFTHPGGFFRPTVSRWTKWTYLISLGLTIPVVIFQAQDNFRFFNNKGGWYKDVRPFEPVFRDPWWAFTCIVLFHVIRKCYGTGVLELIRRSPRFGILLAAICLSIIFTILDIASSIRPFVGESGTNTDGINPWWKLSLVFKCLTDTIMLDDFKTELKRLGIKRMVKEEKHRNSVALVMDHNDDAATYRSDSGSRNRSSTSNANGSEKWYGLRNHNSKHADSDNERFQPIRGPGADMDELEFSTALAIDPSRLSGVQSVRKNSVSSLSASASGSGSNDSNSTSPSRGRTTDEKGNINSHTKPLRELPSLEEPEFASNTKRYEAIKPGSVSNRHTHAAPPSPKKRKQSEWWDSDRFSVDNLDEEILEPEDVDISPTNTRNVVQPAFPNPHTAKSANRKNQDQNQDEIDEKERERRFRKSIGADEFG